MKTLPIIAAAVLGMVATAASAAPCTSSTLATMIALGSCEQQDKTWSNFASVNLPGDAVVSFALVTPVPSVDQHTVTIAQGVTPFTQGATYNLGFDIAVTNPATSTFIAVTGGILLAAPGGVAALTKEIIGNIGGSVSLAACADPVFCPVPGSGTSTTVAAPLGSTFLSVADVFFVDSSNVTGFANTFTERNNIPEPASLAILGLGLLGLGFIKHRRAL